MPQPHQKNIAAQQGGAILSRFVRVAAFASAACVASIALAEPRYETLSVAKMAEPTPHRIYVSDIAINHIVDGRLHVIDGDTLTYLGMISTGYAGNATLSLDRKELYVATTYYTRLARGERTDVVDIHDTQTLEHKGEIVIPARHAQALPYKGLARPSSDGRWLFVQNATPASSVTVVDLKTRKFAAEIPTPGCWIVIPSQTDGSRFATLCGDGTLQSVVLGDNGSPRSRTRSARFFHPDEDPVFVQTDNIGDRHYFVSYKGKVYAADLSGDEPKVEAPWSLARGAEARKGWRPGGYQLIAVHRKTGRLFVAVHADGGEGSHKNPAKEIWVFDLEKKKRVAKLPGHNAIAIAVSQADQPKLFAIDGLKMGLAVYDAGAKPRFLKRMEQIGEAATLMELH
jgi:methylamine dehydrogenase heavy chain